MKIVDLTPEHEPDYLCCLEPWSDDMKDAGDIKSRWYDRMKDQGLVVKLALLDDGQVGGMIQAWPVEHSWLDGRDCYAIGCTWVHAHKGKGVGDQRGKGIGRTLLDAAEREVQARGAQGMAAWGLWIPVWMKSSWYRKRGYRHADWQGMIQLVFKPFGRKLSVIKIKLISCNFISITIVPGIFSTEQIDIILVINRQYFHGVSNRA